MTDTRFNAEFVELIVREVVRRLLASGVEVSSSSSNTISATKATAMPELVLADRLVTLRTVNDRLAGVRRMIVNKQAVITPAVKDELKKYRVELVRQ